MEDDEQIDVGSESNLEFNSNDRSTSHHRRSHTEPLLRRFPTPEVPISPTIVKVWSGTVITQNDPSSAPPLHDELFQFTQRRDKYHNKRIAHYIEQRRNRPSTHLCLLVSDTPMRGDVNNSDTTLDEVDHPSTKVVCTTNPIGRIKKLNEEGNRYKLSMIIGPFGPRTGLSGKTFENIMKRLATDKHGRTIIGVKMAVHYKLDICGVPTREQMIMDLQTSMRVVPDSVRDWDPGSISAAANQLTKKHYNVRVS